LWALEIWSHLNSCQTHTRTPTHTDIFMAHGVRKFALELHIQMYSPKEFHIIFIFTLYCCNLCLRFWPLSHFHLLLNVLLLILFSCTCYLHNLFT